MLQYARCKSLPLPNGRVSAPVTPDRGICPSTYPATISPKDVCALGCVKGGAELPAHRFEEQYD